MADQVFQDKVSYLLFRQTVGIDIEVSILAGMLEPALLFLVFVQVPIHFTAAHRNGITDIQKNQYIRVGDTLPHGRNVRVLLSDMARLDIAFLQNPDQGRFSSRARADDAYQRDGFIGSHSKGG